MKSLDERGVYEVRPGRTVKGAKAEVPNTVAVGAGAMAQPLEDYNRHFRRLQLRRRVVPLAEMIASGTLDSSSDSDTSDEVSISGSESAESGSNVVFGM